MAISSHGKWGDPYSQALDANQREHDKGAHNLSIEKIEALHSRMDKMMGGLTRTVRAVKSEDVLETRMSRRLSEITGNGMQRTASRQKTASSLAGGEGVGVQQTVMRPYNPEYDSPDRQSFPVSRVLANRLWRLFYKLDPTIGTGIDMIGDMPWGSVEFTGQGVDGEIKDTIEYSWDMCQMRSLLPAAAREYMVIGEAAPHLYWDNDYNCWTHATLHNPDQIDVIHAPFIKMDPICEFVPDQRLKEVMVSQHPDMVDIRNSMPPDMVAKLSSNQNIPLSSTNFTFIPRKLHPYDVRGTSLISRMWRILMYEDSIYNASIQTARRMASPLKVAKLGDPSTGWIPSPEQEAHVLNLLAQSELDPQAWLTFHYGLSFELVGTQERVMSIDKHNDVIERIKLIALGISQAFLMGEQSYASAAAGLTVFLQRLKTLREHFEAVFIRPKFLQTMAEINKWVKPTEAELSSRVRVRRSHREVMEDKRYIVPDLQWARLLDSEVNSEMLEAADRLKGLGIEFSKSTLFALGGKDFEEETQQRIKDLKYIQENVPAEFQMPAEDGGGGLGGGFGGGLPPMNPDSFGDLAPPGGGDSGGGLDDLGDALDTDLGGGEADAAKGDKPEPVGGDPFKDQRKIDVWTRHDLADIKSIISDEEPVEEPWLSAYGTDEVAAAVRTGDAAEVWEALQDFLADNDFPARSVTALVDILTKAGVLAAPKRKASLRDRLFEAKALEMIEDMGDCGLV